MMPYAQLICRLCSRSVLHGVISAVVVATVLSACGTANSDGTETTGVTSSTGNGTGSTSPVKGTPPVTSTPGNPTPGGGAPTNSSFAEQVFAQTNEYRAANGAAALTIDAKLTQSAQAYAESMANLGFFSHTGQDGSDPGSRITAVGYRWMTYGENIAEGQQTPAAVMAAWINSSGHRANIVSGNFKNLGVGYALARDGSAYWVQDFGAQ
ncbi:MAG: CAP domain-containing protein [Methylotenera sp.]|nr:CAP domain-containing protein [Oligoflexia bacterium]